MSNRKRSGQGTPATALLERAGVAYTLRPYEHSQSTESYGLEAADALGVEPERVFKTLLADVDGQLVVGIVPVSGSLELKSLARAMGGKRATMADAATAERITGYVVGGISPLGQRRQLATIIDESALEHETVYVSGGRRGLDIELAPDDLVKLTTATVSAINQARR